MSLQTQITAKIKDAMKAKNTVALESLRAIKSALLLLQTQGNDKEIPAEEEIKLIQKLVKQRRDSATLYQEQGRDDLAQPELAQLAIIEQFLPQQMGEDAIETYLKDLIDKQQATSMKDMGKVMGIASKELLGKADGKIISNIIKRLLS